MPWVLADVDRHKAGLTAKQKRQWVVIANSALSSCLAKGGEQSKCEGSERSLIARLGVEDMRRDSETMQNTR